MSDVTQILQQIETGDPSAAEKLLPLVYDELRKLAAARMAQESPDHTLQATALVHEAYVRLVDVEQAQHWNSRGHFFTAAAEAMRRILITNARRRAADKRGGAHQRIVLDPEVLPSAQRDERLVALDEALSRLAESHPEKACLVKLRFFAGLTIAEAAAALEISDTTADRLLGLCEGMDAARGRRQKRFEMLLSQIYRFCKTFWGKSGPQLHTVRCGEIAGRRRHFLTRNAWAEVRADMGRLTEEDIFTDAIQKSPSELPAFLDQACGGDQSLRVQVEALLAAHDQPDSLLDVPASHCRSDISSLDERTSAAPRSAPTSSAKSWAKAAWGSSTSPSRSSRSAARWRSRSSSPAWTAARSSPAFEAERQALALMDHPNIARVLDAGTTESGRPYFVMELVRGLPITDYCDRAKLAAA